MQLVIRVDLDKTTQSLPEIFRLIGKSALTEEAREGLALDASGRIEDDRSRVVGEWQIEENSGENRTHPLEPAYRAAARARYATPRQIEVDRFATVSIAEDGAYVQGWLFIPETAALSRNETTPPAKPPQSVYPIRGAVTKAG